MDDILFLAHRVPFPPNRGDKIRAHHLLRKLAELGSVHVGCFAENAEDRAASRQVAAIAKSHLVVDRRKPLVLAGVEAVLSGKPVSLTAFHSGRLESWVKQTLAAHQIDTIVIFSGQMGQYIPDDFVGRAINDLCDVDSAKFESYAETGERVWLNSREARLLAAEEERLGRRADATILISENEAELYRSRLSDPTAVSVQVMGNGIDAEFFGSGETLAPDLFSDQPGPHFVFTGQMDYPPNEQAALWFIEECLPEIRKNHPEAMFHAVGRNPTAKLLSKRSLPEVRVTGEVPDVRPYIAGADCVVAPLQIARGVQNKVLEAMAMRRPVLLTPEAATGIDAEHGKHWVVAPADSGKMSEAADGLLLDEQARHSMGKAARQFVLDHHAWDAMLEPLVGLIGRDGHVRDAA